MDGPARPIRPILGTAALLAWGLVPPGAIPGWPARVCVALRDDAPPARDDRSERGYYEKLIEPARGQTSPPDPGVLATPVADVREYVLKPNFVATAGGARWTTNGLGMRDAAYDRAKPGGTCRVGLAGDSIACGWGVDDGLGFEPLAERDWGRGGRVEVLNFAVPGHAPGQRWEHFARVGWATGPDLVIFEGTTADLGWDERRLRVLVPRGLGPEAPSYREALAAAGVVAGLSPAEVKARLRPHREAILAGVYRRVVADCRARGVPVAWVLLPRVGKVASPADRAAMVDLARASGFDRTVDLSDAFDGRPAASLAIAPGDFHPNAQGHALLAGRLAAALGDYVSSAMHASRTNGGDPLASAGPARGGASPVSRLPGVVPR